MSEVYRRRLVRIREERDTAQEVVAYVRSQWCSDSIFDVAGFETINREKVISLAENIDTIFLTALFAAFFAAFEGMLREHMSQHHSGFLIPENAGAAFLIDQVAVAQPMHITVGVCDKVHEVRQYRNLLMHQTGQDVLEITFADALPRLSRYVGWLPEPL